MGGCGRNTDLLYAGVFAPATGFQARRPLVVTEGSKSVTDCVTDCVSDYVTVCVTDCVTDCDL